MRREEPPPVSRRINETPLLRAGASYAAARRRPARERARGERERASEDRAAPLTNPSRRARARARAREREREKERHERAARPHGRSARSAERCAGHHPNRRSLGGSGTERPRRLALAHHLLLSSSSSSKERRRREGGEKGTNCVALTAWSTAWRGRMMRAAVVSAGVWVCLSCGCECVMSACHRTPVCRSPPNVPVGRPTTPRTT